MCHISPIFDFVYSVTLYTWELILMVPPLLLLISTLLQILIMIYWVQSWEGMKTFFLFWTPFPSVLC